MKIILFSFILFVSFCSFSQYEMNSNKSPSYPELIEILTSLADSSNAIQLYNMGSSDYGLPIYLCVVNGGRDSLSTFKKARKETTILFNNAIHPGEPDGINAMLIWLKKKI
ncbi:MAG: hypothetical protein P8K10_08750 [Crocinitomicaceae bacterium]|nr:hypothetical protein [Crocinitomicaceae bacterium]